MVCNFHTLLLVFSSGNYMPSGDKLVKHVEVSLLYLSGFGVTWWNLHVLVVMDYKRGESSGSVEKSEESQGV